jgi:hypothetical protein
MVRYIVGLNVSEESKMFCKTKWQEVQDLSRTLSTTMSGYSSEKVVECNSGIQIELQR